MDIVARFRREYEGLDRRVYHRALPAWPGAQVEDTFQVITAVNAWRGRNDEVRHLGAFTVSKHVQDLGLLQEAFRHETAHVAAMVLERHWDHDEPWRRHARACGASAKPTFDGDAWALDQVPASAFVGRVPRPSLRQGPQADGRLIQRS